MVDESGVNHAMGRSHAWVKRGEEYVEPRPMNWGDNLTLIGAMRCDRLLVVSTQWDAVNAENFVRWVRRRLAPRLRPGDVVVMDNLPAHKDARVRLAIEARRARLKRLPAYSHDFNPIEPGWGLMKKHVRRVAPRSATALRRTVRHARYAVTPRHCHQWFAHAGYRVRPLN